MRDEFDSTTKWILARRVGFRCSNPTCRKLTSGPRSDPEKAVNIGVAAHITAAATGGPRYDETLSTEQRKSAENGVWLCQNCAKLVNNDEGRYTVETLHKWKGTAEQIALDEIESITLPDNRLPSQLPQSVQSIAFMIGYDLCALLIDSAEDQSQTISMLEARLRFLGIAANLPREFLLGESKEQQLDDFLSYVIPMLRVAYGDRIAAHFMLPVNVIVTVRDQHQHPKTVQSFDAIEHLLQYMNLPSSLTAQLQEIRQSYVRDVGGGKPFMYQRAENTPLVKWLDTVNDHLLVKDDLETYS